jgi:hypothetical protein
LKVRCFPLLVVGFVTAAAFGPYVTPNIRTEQLAVYGAAFTLLLVLPYKLVNLRPYFPVVLPWLGLVLIAGMGMIPPTPHGLYAAGDPASTIDNLVLPLAVMLLIWAVIPHEMAGRALRTAATVVTFGAALNGVLSVIGTRTDLSFFLRPFWSGGDGETTAERAAQLGRLSGIFNQPAEAGVVYGIAGLLAVWRFREKPKTMLLLLALISMGGLLSVSKVFILGGIPLILIYLWVSKTGAGKMGLLFSLGLVGYGVAQSGVFQQWTGFNYLARLIAPAQNQGLIEFYSAGRWNESSSMQNTFDLVMTISPLTGFGLNGLKVPYDSAWTEAAVIAGILGMVSLGVVFLALLMMTRKIQDPALRTLARFVIVFLIGASLGIPALTANRAATIVWVVLGLLWLMAKKSQQETAPAPYRLPSLTTVPDVAAMYSHVAVPSVPVLPMMVGVGSVAPVVPAVR